MNMTSPDYVYLSFCSYNVPDSFEGTPHWWRNDTLDKEARLAFTSLLIVTLANPPSSEELDAYYDTVRNVSLALFNTSDVFSDNVLWRSPHSCNLLRIDNLVSGMLCCRVKFSEWRRTRLCTSPLRFLPTTCARAQEDYTTGQRLPCRWLIGCFPRSRAAASSTKKGIGKAFMLLLAPPATLTS
ncbi:hypothetical protein RvY_16690-1 [Ramazzottius varieornatus]|uniref:Uncharacterized protein n=1 Tax=Ramazzottius varieornatus TaxID=947166 RepID=A0A1D1W209_RAMVA|nr:hypothetical protein RvY_16690-1 [Ramazzottius varieornatus]